MQLNDLLAEWNESEEAHLEMLYAEWYTHNRNAEYNSQSDVSKSDFNASDHYPDDVHQNGQAS